MPQGPGAAIATCELTSHHLSLSFQTALKQHLQLFIQGRAHMQQLFNALFVAALTSHHSLQVLAPGYFIQAIISTHPRGFHLRMCSRADVSILHFRPCSQAFMQGFHLRPCLCADISIFNLRLCAQAFVQNLQVQLPLTGSSSTNVHPLTIRLTSLSTFAVTTRCRCNKTTKQSHHHHPIPRQRAYCSAGARLLCLLSWGMLTCSKAEEEWDLTQLQH
eukprot:673263-Pelagomonas_calceolata.AAC.9